MKEGIAINSNIFMNYYKQGILLLIKMLNTCKFNGLILLYCLINNKSYSRVSGAQDRKIQKGKILDFWKSYARDVCPSIFIEAQALNIDNILG